MAKRHVSLEHKKKVLQDKRGYVVEYLDADDVIDELIQSNLIGQNAAQQVQLRAMSRVEKNRIILEQLIICGPGALEKFCEILRKTTGGRQSFIAEELEKCKYNTISRDPFSDSSCVVVGYNFRNGTENAVVAYLDTLA